MWNFVDTANMRSTIMCWLMQALKSLKAKAKDLDSALRNQGQGLIILVVSCFSVNALLSSIYQNPACSLVVYVNVITNCFAAHNV